MPTIGMMPEKKTVWTNPEWVEAVVVEEEPVVEEEEIEEELSEEEEEIEEELSEEEGEE